MQRSQFWAWMWGGVLLGACVACSTAAVHGGPAAAPAPDASSFELDGFSLDRPAGWRFVPPDASVGKDTVMVLQGPMGGGAEAPAVEVSRRHLTAMQQRRKPSHILTQMVTEIVQLFDGFQMQGQPEDIQLGGQPAARIRMNFTESLPDGGTVKRSARFYGVVHNGDIWVLRCLGPRDGSADKAFDAIVASVKIAS